MRMKISVLPVIGLIAGSVLLAGCSENTPTVKTTTGSNTTANTNVNIPADPAVHRSDLETLTQRPPQKTATKPLSSVNVDIMPTEREFGMPIYPGAALYKDETGIVNAVVQDGIKSVMLETKDSQTTVTEFYRQEMPTATVTKENPGGDQAVRLSEPSGKNGLRAVEITVKNNKTVIHLTHVAEAAGLNSASSAVPQAGNQPPR